ncbi:MAG: hypothetical protein U5N26_08705 [Candidatus Marinimicrobia bacterium]|nr:hypothetical protein [Candidatus Neomarinimicrobiota bacterium]
MKQANFQRRFQKRPKAVACAKLCDKTGGFAKQVSFPSEKSRYKVPSICREQDVDCIDFIGMLTELHIRV